MPGFMIINKNNGQKIKGGIKNKNPDVLNVL